MTDELFLHMFRFSEFIDLIPNIYTEEAYSDIAYKYTVSINFNILSTQTINALP